jgi:hypothetical protein
MTKRLSIFLFLFVVLTLLNIFSVKAYYKKMSKEETINTILAEIEEVKSSDAGEMSQADFSAEASVGDARVANLMHFFRKYNSPLYDHAQKIVDVADTHKFDYRLLPAIAMQESTLCRSIPSNSYNCWGWGIYGSTVTRFSGYDEAIETVGRGLKKNYIDRGLTTTSAIMSKYTPSSNGSWAQGVNTMLKILE